MAVKEEKPKAFMGAIKGINTCIAEESEEKEKNKSDDLRKEKLKTSQI